MATELYQLRIQGLNQQEYNECVVYCRGDNLSAGDVIVNAKDLLASWEQNIKTAWLDLLPASYNLMRISAKRQATGSGGVEIVTQYQYGVELGGVSGVAQVQQLCPIVRLIPPMGVKSAGRFFLPCIAESDIASNTPSVGWVNNLSSLMLLWVLNNFGSGTIDWQLAIYSRKLDSFSLCMNFDTSPVIGWQRRRQRPY